jgi:hypothetical protein
VRHSKNRRATSAQQVTCAGATAYALRVHGSLDSCGHSAIGKYKLVICVDWLPPILGLPEVGFFCCAAGDIAVTARTRTGVGIAQGPFFLFFPCCSTEAGGPGEPCRRRPDLGDHPRQAGNTRTVNGLYRDVACRPELRTLPLRHSLGPALLLPSCCLQGRGESRSTFGCISRRPAGPQ